MADHRDRAFMSIDLRCACGATLFVECPQESPGWAPEKLVELAKAWNQAHAAHHQEPKRG